MQIKSSRFYLFCLKEIFQNKKEQRQDKGVVLVTVLVCTLLLSLIAGALLSLMTNQARIAEDQIRRIQAYYTSQAGLVHKIERLRRGGDTATENQPITHGTRTMTATINVSDPDPRGIRTLNSRVRYSP